jgi:hypothetical protein
VNEVSQMGVEGDAACEREQRCDDDQYGNEHAGTEFHAA